MAACPEKAIDVPALDPGLHDFSTFDLDPARLICSRRSCRNYKPTPVDKETLQDLIHLAVFAPSGTNSQAWTFTCLIGYVVAPMAADRSIQKKLGIPDSETIHAAVALGYPKETYQRITGRKPPTIRFHTIQSP
jgi:hypothetical protein